MREIGNSNAISELKDKLIYYFGALDTKIKDAEELSYGELLERYRNLLCDRSDYGEFAALIQSAITDYRDSYPDTTLLDEEIVLGENVLNPLNFIGLLSNKITLLSARLDELENEKTILQYSAHTLDDEQWQLLNSENARKRSICLNYIKKCRRMMEAIQQEYGMVRER